MSWKAYLYFLLAVYLLGCVAFQWLT